tara:strand:+ start:2881 stop:3291 length:411 start_codon:yes stop_codon:yes gene_type:complete
MICPRCWENELSDKGLNALSRRDNKTEICSPCGTAEAFEDYSREETITPTKDIEPVKYDHKKEVADLKYKHEKEVKKLEEEIQIEKFNNANSLLNKQRHITALEDEIMAFGIADDKVEMFDKIVDNLNQKYNKKGV